MGSRSEITKGGPGDLTFLPTWLALRTRWNLVPQPQVPLLGKQRLENYGTVQSSAPVILVQPLVKLSCSAR